MKAGGIERGKFVAAEQALGVVPFLVNLDQADTAVAQPIKLLLVPGVGFPGLAAGILAQVVAALAWQVVGNRVLTQTAADGRDPKAWQGRGYLGKTKLFLPHLTGLPSLSW